ncbi:TSUP family transporter [Arsenicicoccus sp. MKL-02]|uniref:Probable membrane transporter protein n=1 Tax=Arsenicicoccus cauae TaxID=2663847 RepID=A0A6I3IB48_9MICO|nr:sulfite exporter TauE/SafE family protein [Arsenicicoccus cauae]MTB71448.1 TSUP family transporter [Arsenicicoccus cauae]
MLTAIPAALLVGALAGLLIGVVMGALGGGGAVLLVPALVLGLGIDAVPATTMCLVVVGLASLVSAWSSGRRGLVDARMAGAFVLCGVLGSALGTRLSHLVDEELLLAMFGGLLLVIAVLMVRRGRDAGASDPGVPVHRGQPDVPVDGLAGGAAGSHRVAHRTRWGPLVGAATGVSLLTGFFGVGGGFAIVPALTLLRVPMRVAVGTSLLVIAGNCLTSLVWRWPTLARLDWPLTTALTVSMVVGGLIGARVGRHVPPPRLQLAFGILLVVVAAVTLLQTLRG